MTIFASRRLIYFVRFNGYLYSPTCPALKFSNLNKKRAFPLRRLLADPARHSRRSGVVRASAGIQTTHPRLRIENPGVNRQAHAAGCTDRADRDTGDRTDFSYRLCRTRSSTGKKF